MENDQVAVGLEIVPRVQDDRRRGRAFDKPKTIYIGPYHHGDSHLQGTERFKRLYLKDLLNRNSTKIEDCIEAMLHKVPQVRGCYPEDVTLSTEDFVVMMLLDSAFIIEAFAKPWVDATHISSVNATPL